MKYLRKFDSVSDMETAIASSEIDIIGLAYNGSTPVFRIKTGGSPVPPAPDPTIPFYVENITNSNETLTIAGYDWNGSGYIEIQIEYSIDGTTWSTWGTTGETPLTRTLQPGNKVYLRATANTWYEWQEDYINHGCVIYGVSKVGGNIMSLLYGSSFTGNETTFPSGSSYNFNKLFNDFGDEDYTNRTLVSASELILPATTLTANCYGNMFSGCASLTAAPALPATTLAERCYNNMFSGCASLTTAPTLPATTLANGCYYYMFYYCTSLTTAPTLPATTMAQNCYQNMFEGCTSLTTAPVLPATTLANYCYEHMFSGCTSLTTAPTLPATTLADSCYGDMFYGCTSLTTAPVLPATTLARSCYGYMFGGCTSLTAAPALQATTLANECYQCMFKNCTALTMAPVLPATTLASGCYYEMFRGCHSLTIAPELPATTLTTRCYSNMFRSCNNLNYIKCLATDNSGYDCTNYWVSGVASSGTFVKAASMTDWTTGNNGIPSGWTVEDATN